MLAALALENASLRMHVSALERRRHEDLAALGGVLKGTRQVAADDVVRLIKYKVSGGPRRGSKIAG